MSRTSNDHPGPEALARAEAAGWAAVRAAGLDASDDSHLWQAVFFAAQRAELDREPAEGDRGLKPAPSG